jgi:hypothetical protein
VTLGPRLLTLSETNEATASAVTSRIFFSIGMSPSESDVDFVAVPMSKGGAIGGAQEISAQTRRISSSDVDDRRLRSPTAVSGSNGAWSGPRWRAAWLTQGLCPILARVRAAHKYREMPIFRDEPGPTG